MVVNILKVGEDADVEGNQRHCALAAEKQHGLGWDTPPALTEMEMVGF